jgi:hypothetical protein
MQASILSGLFVVILFMVVAIFIAVNPVGADMGCFILGTEVNGDNTVEYLGIGNC